MKASSSLAFRFIGSGAIVVGVSGKEQGYRVEEKEMTPERFQTLRGLDRGEVSPRYYFASLTEAGSTFLKGDVPFFSRCSLNSLPRIMSSTKSFSKDFS